MEKLLGFILSIMPLLFGFGFLVPVIRQGVERTGFPPPFGLSPLVFALIIGGGWAIVAQTRKRWL